MFAIEIILLFLLLISCGYVTITDLQISKIENKIIVFALVPGIILNIIYYLFYTKELFNLYLLNMFTVIMISILLYSTHIWAGGDSKLTILIAVLYPARLYLNNKLSLFLIIAFAFVFGFIYLIIDSIIIGVKYKKFINFKELKNGLLNFIKRYLVTFLYITLFNNSISLFKFKLISTNNYIYLVCCLCLVFVVSNFKVLRNKYTIGFLLISNLIITFVKGIRFYYNQCWWVYILSFVIIILRLFISEYNYLEINTSDVRKGMVLSTGTSLQFLNSHINGLPKVSTEDLKSRLTQEEVESIIRWQKSKYGQDTLLIVRKIPFAIFITLGLISYIVLRGILN